MNELPERYVISEGDPDCKHYLIGCDKPENGYSIFDCRDCSYVCGITRSPESNQTGRQKNIGCAMCRKSSPRKGMKRINNKYYCPDCAKKVEMANV